MGSWPQPRWRGKEKVYSSTLPSRALDLLYPNPANWFTGCLLVVSSVLSIHIASFCTLFYSTIFNTNGRTVVDSNRI